MLRNGESFHGIFSKYSTSLVPISERGRCVKAVVKIMAHLDEGRVCEGRCSPLLGRLVGSLLDLGVRCCHLGGSSEYIKGYLIQYLVND